AARRLAAAPAAGLRLSAMAASRLRFTRIHAVLAAVLLAAFVARAWGAAQPSAKAADPATQPAATADAPTITLTPVGRFDFVAPSSEDRTLLPEELSGIAWLEGSHYIA